MQLGDGM